MKLLILSVYKKQWINNVKWLKETNLYYIFEKETKIYYLDKKYNLLLKKII